MSEQKFDPQAFLMQNIEELASECQPLWHPLGFASCVVREIAGSETIRIHYWPANERRTKNPDWPVHTHSYHLESFILDGVVEDIQYQEIVGNKYQVYKVFYTGLDSEIVADSSSIDVAIRSHLHHGIGCTYCVPRGTFHQSRVGKGAAAATLVRLTEFHPDPPLVLGEVAGQRYPYDRVAFDKAEFWNQIRASLDRLSELK